MHYRGLVDADVMFIAKSEEFPASELHAIVHDDGVRDTKAMDDVEEELYGLLRFDRGNRSSFYPLYKLVYGDKQVHVAPGSSFARSDDINP